ncbi:Putative helicase 087L [Frankliniella fusca]|uniref:Helicase 087L n=1 Tax=Frankliniella fusca TaxID=407009 RepID=A0AAE1HJ02_9NEOP|nr:Putative helicase 087L [Frankliniella fusca]
MIICAFMGVSSDHFAKEVKGLRKLKKGAFPTNPFKENEHLDRCISDTFEKLYVVESGAAITSINEDSRCLNIEDSCAEGGNISAFEYSSVVEVHVGSSWEDHGNISDVEYSSIMEVNVGSSWEDNVNSHDKEKHYDYSSCIEINVGTSSDVMNVQNSIVIENNQQQEILFAVEKIYYADQKFEQENIEMQLENCNVMDVNNI